ncbi:MAG: hypothetical protein MZV49_08030 [Rhodopseudomonas palustris]|nr:hypothetical protein [Rhodopseudomonas palustris]
MVPSPGYDLRLQESRRARAAEHYAPSYYGAPVQVAPRATRTPDRWKAGRAGCIETFVVI